MINQVTTEQLRGSCVVEAEQLVKQAFSFEQAAESKSATTILKSGRFIYRCEKRGEWTAVMYPKIGEKVNCHYRKGKNLCLIGWVKGNLMTRTFD